VQCPHALTARKAPQLSARMRAPRCVSALGAGVAGHPQRRPRHPAPLAPRGRRAPVQDAFSARTSGSLLLEALLESADGAAAGLQAAVAAAFARAAAAKARQHTASGALMAQWSAACVSAGRCRPARPGAWLVLAVGERGHYGGPPGDAVHSPAWRCAAGGGRRGAEGVAQCSRTGAGFLVPATCTVRGPAPQAADDAAWWRPREAALLAVGACGEPLLAGAGAGFDLAGLLRSAADDLGARSAGAPPFLAGRALWLAARCAGPCARRAGARVRMRALWALSPCILWYEGVVMSRGGPACHRRPCVHCWGRGLARRRQLRLATSLAPAWRACVSGC
jgi:hypothetical protein